MTENEFRSDKQNSTDTSTNWWKWAFIGLIILILILAGYFIALVQPTLINDINTTSYESTADEIVLTTELNKADTEKLLNTYLSGVLTEDDPKLRIGVDEAVNVEGTIQFLGFDIPFTMVFEPYVMENGNLQLRAHSVQLASFSLPVNRVMSLLANQVDLPDFVAIDSESQIIVANLNELDDLYRFNIRLISIDLENDDIRFNITIPSAVLQESIQNLN